MTPHVTSSEIRVQEYRTVFPGVFGFVVGCGLLLGAVFVENGPLPDRCACIAVALTAIALYIWNKPHEVVISADASGIRISRKVIGIWSYCREINLAEGDVINFEQAIRQVSFCLGSGDDGGSVYIRRGTKRWHVFTNLRDYREISSVVQYLKSHTALDDRTHIPPSVYSREL